MSQFSAFAPTGSTVLLVANSTAPNDVSVAVSSGTGATQYHILNSGTQIAFVAWSTQAAANNAAKALAVIPTAGTPSPSVFPVLPGASVVITLPYGIAPAVGLSFSAITAVSGANNLYITPGEGM